MTFKSELDEISRYRNAYVLALSVALGSLFYGYDIGLIGGILSLGSFQNYFGLDKMNPREKAWLNGNIVAILQLGCLFGALGVGSFSSRYGRKPCLLASGGIYIIGSALQVIVGLGGTREYALSLLYTGRFLGGIGVGMVTALVPSYVSECTPQAIRGRCTGLIQLAINVGIMLSFWVNYFASKNMPSSESQWRVPFAIQIVPGVLFLLAMPFQPESPRYMVEKEEYDRAAQTLAFFVSPMIFGSLGIDGTTAELFATGVYGGVKVVSVALTLAMAVEGIGRKKCLIVGGLGQSAMMLWIGGYSALHPAPTAATPSSYISIVAVYLYAAFFSFGWGPIPWVVAAEVAPNHLRTVVISTATGVNWLFSLTISKLTPIMLNELGYGTFLLFGFCCLIMAFWAWLCLPETAGFGLEEIGLLFETDVILRALQDAPGGRIFIGDRRATPVARELRLPIAGDEDSEAVALLGPDSDSG
ncbi:General substrate transporter [Mycena venus]|uniref:General substrate transporter n=1 Tax=Mycena venus TaxID=2733690 RepID=A0A8H7D872_9AGAR|nr:General substrate transporter [Mycena venus]